MNVRDVLCMARNILLQDDDLARMALSDALEENGFPEEEVAAVKSVSGQCDGLVCPKCRRHAECDISYRTEKDGAGDYVCQDFNCACGEALRTIILRPVAWCSYDEGYEQHYLPIPREEMMRKSRESEAKQRFNIERSPATLIVGDWVQYVDCMTVEVGGSSDYDYFSVHFYRNSWEIRESRWH